MNEIEIISANDQTLSVIAGEVLVIDNPCYNCLRVKESTCNQVFHSAGDARPCEDYFPMPIPLTWPEAMKWRDWAVEKFGIAAYRDALWDLWLKSGACKNSDFDDWLILAKPIIYIKAACLCAVKGNNDG